MTRKEDILQAAQQLFSRFGLKKVTISDIASEAHVSKGTIYKLYRNKGEVFDDVVKTEADMLLQAIQEAVDGEDTVLGKFKAHLLTKMEKFRDLINFYQVTQETSQDYWPFVAETREWFLAQERKIVEDVLRQGNESGELDVKDPALVSHMMVVSLKAQEYSWATKGMGVSLEDYVEMMMDVMINGIRKR
ncbi:MAG: TetR/AcrR family transcriptional regulator [candidate division Zixibacteria bacterium]|nr:TetR/AcrR family transcriptional regulator [candidate division Zixibacteria bacterium]